MNYYVHEIDRVLAEYKESKSVISIKISCNGTSTKQLNLSIDCAKAVRKLLTYIVNEYKRNNPILKDGRYSVNLEHAGKTEKTYVARYFDGSILSTANYSEAVEAITEHNENRLK